jgi:hypothetical protein
MCMASGEHTPVERKLLNDKLGGGSGPGGGGTYPTPPYSTPGSSNACGTSGGYKVSGTCGAPGYPSDYNGKCQDTKTVLWCSNVDPTAVCRKDCGSSQVCGSGGAGYDCVSSGGGGGYSYQYQYQTPGTYPYQYQYQTPGGSNTAATPTSAGCPDGSQPVTFTWAPADAAGIASQWLDVDPTAAFADCPSGTCKGYNVAGLSTFKANVAQFPSYWRINTGYSDGTWVASGAYWFNPLQCQ